MPTTTHYALGKAIAAAAANHYLAEDEREAAARDKLREENDAET